MADAGSAIGYKELATALRATDPAAFLVAPRIVRRVVKRERGLATMGLQVPHGATYSLPGPAALAVLERAELGLGPDDDVPATVLLIAQPDARALAGLGRAEALTQLWRLLFHARVHVALEQRIAAGVLTAQTVRARIERIGAVEFAEVQAVLKHEQYLWPLCDDRTVYSEFAAVYLELRYFDRRLLPWFFPAIRDYPALDQLLAEDLDADALFAATRPAGAADPPLAVEPERQPAADATDADAPRAVVAGRSEAAYRRLTAQADQAAKVGNTVRAALCHARAAWYGPPRRAGPARAAARAERERFLDRLGRALGLDPDDLKHWRRALPPLFDRAARGAWTVERRVLHDLQNACIDHEGEAAAVDLIAWVKTLGRVPLVRRLPHLRAVRIVRHLRGAARRVAAIRTSEADRDRLAALLQAARARAEERLRDRCRPVIRQALEQTGLTPRSLPERIALGKVVEELLDHVVERGFLTLGDLRDALSRNPSKLPDLAGPSEFCRGDPVLRADRALAAALDGLYRRGEIYLRALQRFSALAFGTRAGRFLTRHVALPFGGAYLLLAGIQHTVLLGWEMLTGIHCPIVYRWTVLPLGVFFLGLITRTEFRRAARRAWRTLARGLRLLFYDGPRWILRQPLVRRVLDSRVAAVLGHWILAPLVPTALLLGLGRLARPSGHVSPRGAGVAFAAVSVLWNTRFGRDVEEVLSDEIVRAWRGVRVDLLPALYRLIMDTSHRVLDAIERVLYSVDEWLRFHAGDRRGTVASKAVLGIFWGMIIYVVRFCVNLLIEPQVNPIKHFPVVTVAHKVLMPSLPHVQAVFVARGYGAAEAGTIAFAILAAIPGIFGFLVWELKENWRLYEANRPKSLQPVPVGHHGETVVRLLRPGLHSGTLPKAYARLRRAARRRGRGGPTRKSLVALHRVEEAVRHFLDRDLLALLSASRALGALPLVSGAIRTATNRIQVELRCLGRPAEGLHIAFEEQAGWLVARVVEPGWLAGLSLKDQRILENALAGWYKLAGVELVREAIAAVLPPARVPHAIVAEGLAVWPPSRAEAPCLYDLRHRDEPPDGPLVAPECADPAADPPPPLDARQLLFRDQPIAWERWVSLWECDPKDGGPPAAPLVTARLLPEMAQLAPPSDSAVDPSATKIGQAPY
jgi:hypothetical protein